MILFIDKDGDFHTEPAIGRFFNRENGVAVVSSITPRIETQTARLELITAKAKMALAAAEWAERAHAPDDVVWGWAGRERWLKEPIVALSGYGRTFARQFFFERLAAAKTMVPEFPCERCGYTQRDQEIHGDHHLCPSKIGGDDRALDLVIAQLRQEQKRRSIE